jgi:hypothetical protein
MSERDKAEIDKLKEELDERIVKNNYELTSEAVVEKSQELDRLMNIATASQRPMVI